MMVALDGDAARALAAIARERWHAATGRRLAAVAHIETDPWPEQLEPSFEGVDVGIARTMPPKGEAQAVREIERLYLDMIASARRSIYIENQYFTSPRIAAALCARLAEPDGPEIVLVLRLLSHGWLERIFGRHGFDCGILPPNCRYRVHQAQPAQGRDDAPRPVGGPVCYTQHGLAHRGRRKR